MTRPTEPIGSIEQQKYHNVWTYCVQGLPNVDLNGFKIPFQAGHSRRAAFAKIRARVGGTALASKQLGVG